MKLPTKLSPFFSYPTYVDRIAVNIQHIIDRHTLCCNVDEELILVIHWKQSGKCRWARPNRRSTVIGIKPLSSHLLPHGRQVQNVLMGTKKDIEYSLVIGKQTAIHIGSNNLALLYYPSVNRVDHHVAHWLLRIPFRGKRSPIHPGVNLLTLLPLDWLPARQQGRHRDQKWHIILRGLFPGEDEAGLGIGKGRCCQISASVKKQVPSSRGRN